MRGEFIFSVYRTFWNVLVNLLSNDFVIGIIEMKSYTLVCYG